MPSTVRALTVSTVYRGMDCATWVIQVWWLQVRPMAQASTSLAILVLPQVTQNLRIASLEADSTTLPHSQAVWVSVEVQQLPATWQIIHTTLKLEELNIHCAITAIASIRSQSSRQLKSPNTIKQVTGMSLSSPMKRMSWSGSTYSGPTLTSNLPRKNATLSRSMGLNSITTSATNQSASGNFTST